MGMETTLRGALDIATKYFQDGKFQDSAKISREILEQRPGEPEALRILADSCGRVGAFDEAAKALGILVGSNFDASTVRDVVNLGVARRRLGDYSEAERLLSHVAGIQPNNREVLAQLNATRNAQGVDVADQEYQVNFERWRLSRYMDYPKHIQVETLAVCNASCFFCPYPKMERQGDRMSDELFEKIIQDLEKIPRDLPFSIELSKVNEPFIDKRMFDFYEIVSERLPHAAIYITTNGSALNERALDQLERFPAIGYMCISMNDHRPEEYEATMGIPYARTLDVLRRLHERLEKKRYKFPITISRVGDSTAADAEFVRWAKQEFPLFNAFFYSRFDWIQQVDLPAMGQVPGTACKRWFDMSVMASGKVSLCCIDGEGKHQIGDLNEQSVLDVYNSPGYRGLRESAPNRMGGEPCGGCVYR